MLQIGKKLRRGSVGSVDASTKRRSSIFEQLFLASSGC